MIEIPRAALTADEIALESEFFSFGTNDLTQMTFGFSRDDSEPILEAVRCPEDPAGRSVRVDRSERGRPADGNSGQEGPIHSTEHQARHLRRAWRRTVIDRVLPQDWIELTSAARHSGFPSHDWPPHRQTLADSGSGRDR